MRNMIKSLLIVCLLGVAYGQQLNPEDTQFHDFHEIDSVHLQNLSIDLSVPVINKKGAIPFSYALEGVSDCISAPIQGDPGVSRVHCGIGLTKADPGGFTNWALTGINPSSGWQIYYQSVVDGECAADGDGVTTYSWPILISPDSQTYYLPTSDSVVIDHGPGTACNNNGFSGRTIDGGLLVSSRPPFVFDGVVATPWPISVTVTQPNGVSITTSSQTSSIVTDPFGNSISHQFSGSLNLPYTDTFTDTLGVYPAFTANSPSKTLTGEHYSWTDTSGSQRSVTVGYSAQTAITMTGCSGNSILNENDQAYLVSNVTYPDGTSYQFGYDTAGRIHTITLRTGGQITYSYGPLICPSLIPSSISRATSDGTTTYTVATFQAASYAGTTTTVLDPGNNKTIYTFMGTYAAGQPIARTPLTLTQIHFRYTTLRPRGATDGCPSVF
jgi:YD repeat-containing protein